MVCEIHEFLLQTSELMQTRRQELLAVISKRAAQGTGVVPPPKRIALTPIRPDVVANALQRTAGKKRPSPSPPPPVEREPVVPQSKPQPAASANWWDAENIATQMEKQADFSPTAIFEPRLSPINAEAIFREVKRQRQS